MMSMPGSDPRANQAQMVDADDGDLEWQAAIEEEILEMQSLGQEIAAAWVSPKSAVELVDEQRR